MASQRNPIFHDLILYSSIKVKVALLVLIVLIGSSLPDYLKPRSSFFSSSNNFINQIYVKYVWGWTLLVLIPLIAITTRGLSFIETIRHFGRLFVNHVIWFGVTSLFVGVRKVVGECSNETFDNKKECHLNGHQWFDFDISGHVFLLSFCILVLSEEITCLHRNEIWNLLITTPPTSVNSPGKSTGKNKNDKYRRYALAVSLYIIQVVTCLELILNFIMITATSLFFHTFGEKVIGLVFSLVAWFVTYRVIYGSVSWVPCKVICRSNTPQN